MPRRKLFVICTLPQCNGDHFARGYCQKHYMQWRKGRVPENRPAPLRTAKRSHCCSAPVESGLPHRFGKQYCTDCGEPCYWMEVLVEHHS